VTDISIIIFLIVLVLLNVIVFTRSKGNRRGLIISGLVMMVLFTPLHFFLTLIIIGNQTGDGIAGSVAGVTFGMITCINGLVILIKGIVEKRKEDEFKK